MSITMQQQRVTLTHNGETVTFNWPFSSSIVDISTAAGSRLVSVEEAHQLFDELFTAGAR